MIASTFGINVEPPINITSAISLSLWPQEDKNFFKIFSNLMNIGLHNISKLFFVKFKFIVLVKYIIFN